MNEPHRSPRRLTYAALASVIILAGVAVYAFLSHELDTPVEEQVTIGGPFTLTAQTGGTLSDKDLHGEPFAVFFGFTYCPEICPTTLWEMTQALNELGRDADRLKVVFVSVDPERDTPEALALYLQAFDPRIVGLTGSEADLAAVGRDYRAHWKKIASDDGDYTMDHTASIYLMDAEGRFFGTIPYGEAMEPRVAELRRLIDEGGA